jgi:hypothetical protein
MLAATAAWTESPPAGPNYSPKKSWFDKQKTLGYNAEHCKT